MLEQSYIIKKLIASDWCNVQIIDSTLQTTYSILQIVCDSHKKSNTIFGDTFKGGIIGVTFKGFPFEILPFQTIFLVRVQGKLHLVRLGLF